MEYLRLLQKSSLLSKRQGQLIVPSLSHIKWIWEDGKIPEMIYRDEGSFPACQQNIAL